MEKSKRNGEIDFLRFLFCIVIVLRHSIHALPEGILTIVPRGALSVEFFFLVSGYLLACSAQERISSAVVPSAGKDTSDFLRHKLRSILPYIVLAGIVSFTVSEICLPPAGPYALLTDFVRKLYDIFLLSIAGFGTVTELWYVSAMIISFIILYPILIKHFDECVRIIAPVISLFTLGFIAKNYSSLLTPSEYIVFTYKGMLRAVGEICLGISLYPAIQRLKTLEFSKKGRLTVSFVQLFCWVVSLTVMFRANDSRLDFFVLALMCIGVSLTFSHKGYFSDRFDRPIFYKLGKLSFVLYLSNRWVAISMYDLYERFCENNTFDFGLDLHRDYWIILSLYLVFTAFFCMLIYFVSLFIRNKTHKSSLNSGGKNEKSS